LDGARVEGDRARELERGREHPPDQVAAAEVPPRVGVRLPADLGAAGQQVVRPGVVDADAVPRRMAEQLRGNRTVDVLLADQLRGLRLGQVVDDAEAPPHRARLRGPQLGERDRGAEPVSERRIEVSRHGAAAAGGQDARAAGEPRSENGRNRATYPGSSPTTVPFHSTHAWASNLSPFMRTPTLIVEPGIPCR